MCKNFKNRLRILHDMLPTAAICQNIIPVDYLLNTAAKKPTLRFYKINEGLPKIIIRYIRGNHNTAINLKFLIHHLPLSSWK